MKTMIVLAFVLAVGLLDFAQAGIDEKIDGCLKELEPRFERLDVRKEVVDVYGSTKAYWRGVTCTYFPSSHVEECCDEFSERVQDIIWASSCEGELVLALSRLNPRNEDSLREIETKYPDIISKVDLANHCSELKTKPFTLKNYK